VLVLEPKQACPATAQVRSKHLTVDSDSGRVSRRNMPLRLSVSMTKAYGPGPVLASRGTPCSTLSISLPGFLPGRSFGFAEDYRPRKGVSDILSI
jgi:hypothetical protein